jgi:hypothetical protein
MGWDAAATKNGEMLCIAPRFMEEQWSTEDLPLREVFKVAARRVRDIVGGQSGNPEPLELSGSYDRSAFERVFAMRFADIPGGLLEWSADQLREECSRARWVVPDGDIECASYWKVKEFVTTCVANELGVHFGW